MILPHLLNGSLSSTPSNIRFPSKIWSEYLDQVKVEGTKESGNIVKWSSCISKIETMQSLGRDGEIEVPVSVSKRQSEESTPDHIRVTTRLEIDQQKVDKTRDVTCYRSKSPKRFRRYREATRTLV